MSIKKDGEGYLSEYQMNFNKEGVTCRSFVSVRYSSGSLFSWIVTDFPGQSTVSGESVFISNKNNFRAYDEPPVSAASPGTSPASLELAMQVLGVVALFMVLIPSLAFLGYALYRGRSRSKAMKNTSAAGSQASDRGTQGRLCDYCREPVPPGVNRCPSCSAPRLAT